MFSRHGFRAYVGFTVAASGCMTAALYPASRHPSDGAAGPAIIGRERILAATVPICHAIAPNEPVLQLSAATGATKRETFWAVDCESPAGVHIASVLWNATTGRLCLVSRPWVLSARHTKPMSGLRAIRSARYWLNTLQIVPNPSAWKPTSVEMRSNMAVVLLTGEGRRIHIRIDQRTGDLVSALCERPRRTKPQGSSYPQSRSGIAGATGAGI